MFTDLLEDIGDSSQSLLIVNRRDAQYKICDIIKRIQAERKIVLLSTGNMGKDLHKVLEAVVE